MGDAASLSSWVITASERRRPLCKAVSYWTGEPPLTPLEVREGAVSVPEELP